MSTKISMVLKEGKAFAHMTAIIRPTLFETGELQGRSACFNFLKTGSKPRMSSGATGILSILAYGSPTMRITPLNDAGSMPITCSEKTCGPFSNSDAPAAGCNGYRDNPGTAAPAVPPALMPGPSQRTTWRSRPPDARCRPKGADRRTGSAGGASGLPALARGPYRLLAWEQVKHLW